MDMPDLTPEAKLNMKLDDIINYKKRQAGISHNMQFGNKKRKPFIKRRYKSQNWRLRQNGPNTPRYKYPWRSRFQRSHPAKIRAFLERKYRTAPMHSVFHRLGWTPTQAAARSKLWFAMNYRRPEIRNFSFRTNFFRRHTANDPNRFKKMLASAKYYNQFHGLQNVLGGEPQALNEMNIKRLNEAVGGHIMSIKENKLSDNVSEVTITRINPTNQSGSIMNGLTNSVFNQRVARDDTNDVYWPQRNQNGSIRNGLTNSVFNHRVARDDVNDVDWQLSNPGTSNISPLLRNRNMPPLVAGTANISSQMMCAAVPPLMPPLVRNDLASTSVPLMNAVTNMPPLVMSSASTNGPVNNSLNGLPLNMAGGAAFASQQSIGIDTPLSIHATSLPFHMRFTTLNPHTLLDTQQEQALMEM